MNSSKQGRTGIEDKAGKAKPIGAKVVTKADARARRVLCNLENEGVLPAKCRAADDLNEGKSRKQKLLAGRPVPRKFGVNLTNNNGSARASILPLRSQCGTDEKGNVGLMLASKSKYASASGKPPKPANVGLSGKHASASGKPPRSSNIGISGKPASASGKPPRYSSDGTSDKPSSVSGKHPRVFSGGPSEKTASASGKPPRFSSGGPSVKPACAGIKAGVSNMGKSRGCPPNAKGVSSISGTTIPLKRKGRVHRGFTATLTARSEAIVGPLDAKAQGQLPDIDEEDNENVLAVVEYVDDIYHFYWDIEARRFLSSSYMSSQTDINQKMRGILINWLIDIHFKFDLMPETLFLMTNLIDRFLSVHIIKRKDFQLVGITAMLVASKYEELWSPKVKELIEISDNSYTHAEMLSMEKLILNKLRFNLTIPTPYVFMKRFLKAARADKQLEHLSFYLIELCLVEYEALKWKPSMLAACAIYTAQHVLQRMPAWTHLLQKHAHYEESELKACATMMAGFHQKAEKGDLKIVYNKYSSSQFESVAKIPSAVSLLLEN